MKSAELTLAVLFHAVRSLRRSACAMLLLVPAVGGAQTCAGFTDVPSDSAFCANVEWVRNRGVTLGCGGALYCPDSSVNRLAMAAFLNRLGSVLSPVALASAGELSAEQLSGGLACQTALLPAAGYPRRASIDARLSGKAMGEAFVAIHPKLFAEHALEWASGTQEIMQRVDIAAGGTGQVSHVGSYDLEAGRSYRFGLDVQLGVDGASSLESAHCVLRITVFNYEHQQPYYDN